ncbi:MAG: 3',5'-cyclic-nucleotide phosphodiesterase [Acidobacteriota bacterium]|nr:3',5'-cyclic-nucleotide phosphodiesterase [Acidobacteriota bacterium]
MNITFLGTYGGLTDTTSLTGFLVDDFLAVDAGCLTQKLDLDRQRRITDVLISHTHLDHTQSLAFLADNLCGETLEPIRIWACKEVIEGLQQHIFNNITWPDFTLLPDPDNPVICFREIRPEAPFTIGRLQITAVPVNHTIPCTGFMVHCRKTGTSLIYTADTTTTDRIWELANACDDLKAVVVDCSFPNEQEELALVSGHMTPNLLAADLAKLKQDCQVLVYHQKPNYEDILQRQLDAMGDPRLVTQIQDSCLALS